MDSTQKTTTTLKVASVERFLDDLRAQGKLTIRPVRSREKLLPEPRHNPYATGRTRYESCGGSRLEQPQRYAVPQIEIISKRGRPRKTSTAAPATTTPQPQSESTKQKKNSAVSALQDHSYSSNVVEELSPAPEERATMNEMAEVDIDELHPSIQEIIPGLEHLIEEMDGEMSIEKTLELSELIHLNIHEI